MLISNSDHCDSKSAEFFALLCCPECSGQLEKSAAGLLCAKCRLSFPIADGIIHFVPTEKYVSNFGFEWTKYARTLSSEIGTYPAEEVFRSKTGFMPEDIKGKWILDAGCGMGVFAEVASRWGAKVVGIDLSRAAEVAAQNLADRNNVRVCHADLRRLPFAASSFDFIYSIGVLHHTPNCEQSFKGLIPYLKPGGVIAIWLYSAYDRDYRMSDLYRRITTKLPLHILHRLCVMATSLYYVHRALRLVPGVGRYLSRALYYLVPMSLQKNRELRILDTFDWYSPKFQSKHTYEEVFGWFDGCGLRDIRVLRERTAVQGRRLAEAEGAARERHCHMDEAAADTRRLAATGQTA